MNVVAIVLLSVAVGLLLAVLLIRRFLRAQVRRDYALIEASLARQRAEWAAEAPKQRERARLEEERQRIKHQAKQRQREARREPITRLLKQLAPLPPSHPKHPNSRQTSGLFVGDLEWAFNEVVESPSHEIQNGNMILLRTERRNQGYSTDSDDDFLLHTYKDYLARLDDEQFVGWSQHVSD